MIVPTTMLKVLGDSQSMYKTIKAPPIILQNHSVMKGTRKAQNKVKLMFPFITTHLEIIIAIKPIIF